MTAVCLQFLHEFSVTDESFPISKMVYQLTRRRKTQSCGIRLGYQLGCYLAAVHSGLTLCRANSLPNVEMHVFLSLCNTKINLCGKYLKAGDAGKAIGYHFRLDGNWEGYTSSTFPAMY